MNKEIFYKAKKIREDIQALETKQIQIKHFKIRADDMDFNLLRQLAFDGCSYAINRLENDFEQL